MNEVVATPATDASITSRDMAELVNKRHDNVKRTIEALINQGVIKSPQIEEISTATKPATVYRFTGEQGKRDSIVVVAQLSPEFTARLVDRWQELEQQAKRSPSEQMQSVLSDPSSLRGLLLGYTEKVLALESTLKEQAPKVETYDRIANADGSFCMRDAAKILQVRPIDLKNLLIMNRWIYGRPGHTGWLAYQDKIQSGVLMHKVYTTTREDGTEKTVEQVRVTSKGLSRLGEMLMRKAA